MKKGLYAIRDVLAGQVVGGILMYPHDTAAVRFFGDVASDPQTFVSKHIDDHDLVYLGHIDEEAATITPAEGLHVVITGAAWKAAQESKNG